MGLLPLQMVLISVDLSTFHVFSMEQTLVLYNQDKNQVK